MIPATPPPPGPRLLLVAYCFPPVQAIAAQRLYHLWTEGRSYFQQIEVLTAAHHPRWQDDSALHTTASLTLVPCSDLRGWCLGQSPTPFHLPPATGQRFWQRWLRTGLAAFPFNVLLRDGGWRYLWGAYWRGVRLVRRHHLTHLFSSYGPCTDHLVALALKWRFPHLHWTADYRDLPLVAPGKTSARQGLPTWLWQLFNRFADLRLVVSAGLARHFPATHPALVLRNGIDPRALELARPACPASEFTIVYTGGLYPGWQDPQPLFAAIALLEQSNYLLPQLRLVYAGKDEKYWQSLVSAAGLSSRATVCGWLTLAQARDLQRHAQINLLLSWTTPHTTGILTGKLYDYLAAGVPILALINGVADPELESLVASSGAGCVAYPHQISAIAAFLRKHYAAWQQGQTYPGAPLATLQALAWPSLMRQYAAALGLPPLAVPDRSSGQSRMSPPLQHSVGP